MSVNNVLQHAYFNQRVDKKTEGKPLYLNISKLINNELEQIIFTYIQMDIKYRT